MNTETRFQECLNRIGENIKRIREEQHITREDLASKLPFSAANDLKDYEEGTREMGVFTLIRIAEILGVEPERLLE